MEFSKYALFHLLTILASLFVLSHCTQTSDTLSSCLIHNNVYNFSLHENDPTNYFKLLEGSIRNLRFTGPTVPKPVAIILPESKEQLASSVRCCNRGSFEIRVRSGGHSYEGTSYVAYGGPSLVLIDIMNLNRVSVDMESETAWVEAGATLGQTYYAISESSKTHGFPGGACPTVGMGGHVSGGGFGSLFRKYGLAADNIVDALLIDANGKLLDKELMGDDVFWAIRGGGGGVFGIIFAWKIKLVKVPEILTGFIVSRPGTKDEVAKLVEKWQKVAPNLDDDFYLSLVVGADLPEMNTTGISATFKGLYLGRKNIALAIVENAFPELRIDAQNCKEMSWIESVLYLSGLEQGSSISSLNDRFLFEGPYYKAKSDYVRTPIPRSGIASAVEILENEPKGFVILDPYGGAMRSITSESIPYPHREGNLFMIQYVIKWTKDENEKNEDYMDWMRGFYAKMAPYVSSGPRAAYINYMDFDIGVMGLENRNVSCFSDDVAKARVWGEKYFLQNYDRLVRAKTVIDPFNVFRHQQGIFPFCNERAQI